MMSVDWDVLIIGRSYAGLSAHSTSAGRADRFSPSAAVGRATSRCSTPMD